MPKSVKTQSDRRPVLFIGVGRQRVGKTTFLNTVIQAMREQGAQFVIWNADLLNVTYNLPLFHDDVLEPPSADFEDVKSWLEERIQDQIEGQYNAFLDVGGGDTPLSRLVREIPIVQTLEKQGIRVVLAHVSYTPASLAAGIEEGRAYVLETEWPDIGAVSVYAIPGEILAVRPDLKAGAFRERYGVQFHKDIAAAAEFWRRFPGHPSIEVGRVQHPRRSGSGV